MNRKKMMPLVFLAVCVVVLVVLLAVLQSAQTEETQGLALCDFTADEIDRLSYSGNNVEATLLNCGFYGGQYMMQTSRELVRAVGRLIRGIGFEDLSGPVGIYQVTQQQASLGLQNYILLIALLSLNVGVFNLLPLPILDGGRILLTLVEMIMGRPLNKKLEAGITAVGVAMVLTLMVFVTWQDLMRLLVQ